MLPQQLKSIRIAATVLEIMIAAADARLHVDGRTAHVHHSKVVPADMLPDPVLAGLTML